MVEWHDGGRVLRQFGCAQPIPNPPVDISDVHGMEKKGPTRESLNWAQKHEPYIFLWNQRHLREGSLLRPSTQHCIWHMGNPSYSRVSTC
ncbi:hypothetical protein E1A91_D05G232600v1 [Gossypium mustelinum]|uniref:Uncharacterized protein n=1 Tax=Gossypium mustelinum TaxID=34275 RepID=A0A5D2UZX9_GOSMU|nr:hypothetical protein E1A91_D05G232600v1 [Gossypium mustelinum]